MLIKTTNRLIAILSLLLLKYGLFVNGQSNYASHANNIGYRGEGLPEEATLDGKVRVFSIFLIGVLTTISPITSKVRTPPPVLLIQTHQQISWAVIVTAYLYWWRPIFGWAKNNGTEKTYNHHLKKYSNWIELNWVMKLKFLLTSIN